eukprot:10157924-Karenia_brevis.AAC.1
MSPAGIRRDPGIVTDPELAAYDHSGKTGVVLRIFTDAVLSAQRGDAVGQLVVSKEDCNACLRVDDLQCNKKSKVGSGKPVKDTRRLRRKVKTEALDDDGWPPSEPLGE